MLKNGWPFRSKYFPLENIQYWKNISRFFLLELIFLDSPCYQTEGVCFAGAQQTRKRLAQEFAAKKVELYLRQWCQAGRHAGELVLKDLAAHRPRGMGYTGVSS